MKYMKSKREIVPLILGLLVVCASAGNKQHPLKSKIPYMELKYCDSKIKNTIKELSGDSSLDYSVYPRSIAKNEKKWNCVRAKREEWCSGFWPGILWYDYENTHDSTILHHAEKYTESLKFISECPAYDHDLGFLIYQSFGNGYRLTHNEAYKKVLLRTADTLATLYNPKVGTILSWPRERKPQNWPHNTIMDNMINLELMFFASQNGGNKRLYDMAVSHAEKTMKNNFRPDYTSYHVAVYDTINGQFIKGVTHQGYSDNSMWARGQAWGIYGFTMVYRYTHNKRFLDFTQKITDAYLKRLPKDYIPYWDFDDPSIPNAPRDASAACIVASGLLELSTYLPYQESRKYRYAALKMIKSLSSRKYESGRRNNSFLLHSTGNKPAGYEIDASIIYADYYYIEALTRLRKMNIR